MNPTLPITTLAAPHAPVTDPRSLTLIVAAFVCLGLTQLPAVMKRDLGFARRCYWGGTAGAMVCVFLAGFPDWIGGLAFAAVVLLGMALAAYFTSPFIKVGGKVYAFRAADERADEPAPSANDQSRDPDYDPIPDQYGTGVAATKQWWLMVPALALCSLTVATNLGQHANRALLIGAAVAIVVVGLGYGVNDASWGYRIARGQSVQFAFVSLVTVGVFAVFYLLGFVVGSRIPLRPKSSMERAVHPRFRDEPPG